MVRALPHGAHQHSAANNTASSRESWILRESSLNPSALRSAANSSHTRIRRRYPPAAAKIRVLYGVQSLRKHTAPAGCANPRSLFPYSDVYRRSTIVIVGRGRVLFNSGSAALALRISTPLLPCVRGQSPEATTVSLGPDSLWGRTLSRRATSASFLMSRTSDPGITCCSRNSSA